MTKHQLHLLKKLAAIYGQTVAEPDELDAVRAILAERERHLMTLRLVKNYHEGKAGLWLAGMVDAVNSTLEQANGAQPCGS